jgi:hypothetical protein
VRVSSSDAQLEERRRSSVTSAFARQTLLRGHSPHLASVGLQIVAPSSIRLSFQSPGRSRKGREADQKVGP